MSSTNDDMACRALVELVTDYLEDHLPLAERRRFAAHLAACSDCRAYLEQMRAALGVLGTLSESTISADARARLLRVYRAWAAE
jgi:anti-sigma factor RsiW